MTMSERHESKRPHGAARRRDVRNSQIAAAFCAALLLCLALPILWPSALRDEPVALAAPIGTTVSPSTSPSPSPTVTVSPTATPLPAQLSIVSPSSHSGPVGAIVTVSGQNFPGTAVSLYGTSDATCGGAQTPLGSAPVNGGSVSTNFTWPTSLNAATSYYVCAAGVANPPSYRVLSATAPTVQLSSSSAEVGKQETISGANFLGLPPNSTVTIAVKDAKGTTTTLPSQALVADDGTFNLPWTVTGAAGGATILAQSAPENGARSALQATTTFTILAPASPTVATTPAAGGSSASKGSSHNSSNAGLVVALIVGIVLLILVILGVVAYLLLRKREGSPEGSSFGNDNVPGAYPGYADRSRIPANVPNSATGRQAAVGRFGHPEFSERADAFPGQGIGGVAQWDEPGPAETYDWQPRPMTGYGQHYDRPQPNDAPTYPGSQGGPTDPWASQAGGYGALPSLNPDDEWGDGATQAADSGMPTRLQRPPKSGQSPDNPYTQRGRDGRESDDGNNW